MAEPQRFRGLIRQIPGRRNVDVSRKQLSRWARKCGTGSFEKTNHTFGPQKDAGNQPKKHISSWMCQKKLNKKTTSYTISRSFSINLAFRCVNNLSQFWGSQFANLKGLLPSHPSPPCQQTECCLWRARIMSHRCLRGFLAQRIWSNKCCPWIITLIVSRKWYPYMGVSLNGGTPQIIHFNRGFHYKPSILRYHYFRKPPISRVPKVVNLIFFLNTGRRDIYSFTWHLDREVHPY